MTIASNAVTVPRRRRGRRVALAEGLPAAEVIRIELRARGFPTIQAWADAVGLKRSSASACIRGKRPAPHVRERLAATLGWPKRRLSDLLDGLAEQ